MRTFVAIGDIHGAWTTSAIEAITGATKALGRVPDVMFAVGDVEAIRHEEDMNSLVTPARYRTMGSFSELAPSDLACPVYFIGGNHEPYAGLDAIPGPWPVLWGDPALGVNYLGRVGAAKIAGLNVAWISGIYSKNQSTLEERRPGNRPKTYYMDTELRSLPLMAEELGTKVDILLTHDWPSGLPFNRPGPHETTRAVGDSQIRELTEELAPRLHLCGHMHYAYEATIGETTVHCLNLVPGHGRHPNRPGWWRAYEKLEDSSIRCVAVGSSGSSVGEGRRA